MKNYLNFFLGVFMTLAILSLYGIFHFSNNYQKELILNSKYQVRTPAQLSKLDKEKNKRASTTYLIDKKIKKLIILEQKIKSEYENLAKLNLKDLQKRLKVNSADFENP